MTMGSEDPKALARRIVETMHAKGRAYAFLDLEILDVGPGHAKARMKVREDFLNSHGICHGGLIFTFADTVFGFACNSRNEASVGTSCDITYLRQVAQGEILTAEAKEIHAFGRGALFDIVVTDHDGERVALMHARSVQTGGSFLPEQESPA